MFKNLDKTYNDCAKINVINTFGKDQVIDCQTGTAGTAGKSTLAIGNNKQKSEDKNSYGQIFLYGEGASRAVIKAPNVTAERTFLLPDNGGTLALTSDIPTDFVSKASGGTFSGNLTVNTQNGTTSSVGSSCLNLGNNIASGTAKNAKGILLLYGKGANHATLAATNVTANRAIELPNNSGTIALTSDIPIYKLMVTLSNTTNIDYITSSKINGYATVIGMYISGIAGGSDMLSHFKEILFVDNKIKITRDSASSYANLPLTLLCINSNVVS